MPIRKSGVSKFSVAIDFFRYGQRNLRNSFDYQIISRRHHIVLRNHNTYTRRKEQQDCCLQEYLHIHLPFTKGLQPDEVETAELTGVRRLYSILIQSSKLRKTKDSERSSCGIIV